MPQKASAGARWFGWTSNISVNTGATPVSTFFWEIGEFWRINITGGAVSYTLRMPYDVRNYDPGYYGLILNRSVSTKSIVVQTNSGSNIVTIAPGENAKLFLVDASTADGSWRVIKRTTGAQALKS